MILDYVDEPVKPCEEDNKSSSYAKKGMFNILGSNGTIAFDCDTPFYSVTTDDGLDKVQIDSDYSDEIVLMVSAMLATLSERNIGRAIKLGDILRNDSELIVELNDIDVLIE